MIPPIKLPNAPASSPAVFEPMRAAKKMQRRVKLERIA
jgi:hypothetical protein